MKWSSLLSQCAPLLAFHAVALFAVQPSAPPYYDLPPSYEEATTYTLYLKAGEEKQFDISELLRLANQGYTTVKIKVQGHHAGTGWTSPGYSSGYGSARLPHCRLLKQDSYYYRVLLDNTIYESNLSYDDAILLIGKLVSLNSCTF
ncbi:hypothetical protein [Kistimonas asteriae]|uniref:hypothetical protein n=1 Tax=Kistimonas asteriae TaxID=517724 RepID=UPI001BAAA8B1|nr:hypothetical protein [Kistimonas asteriae]